MVYLCIMKRGKEDKPVEKEGKAQSMKKLTKNHKKFMESRHNSDSLANNDNPKAKEDLENILLTSVTRL